MEKVKKESILVIEQNEEIFFEIESILCQEYRVVFAKNTSEGLRKLTKKGIYKAILIDSFDEEREGFNFLTELKKEIYSHPPVIALLKQYDARICRTVLKAGVEEFVVMPIEGAVLENRLKNVIARANLIKTADNKFVLKFDSLTGLFNRYTMYHEIRNMLEENPNVKYGLIFLDINKFSLFNATLGEKEGDKLLCYVADFLREICDGMEMCCYGRVGSDVYSIFQPYNQALFNFQIERIKKHVQRYRSDYLVELAAGIYIIDDSAVSVEAMFTRARMAVQSNKADYLEGADVYDSNMERAASSEQSVINDMRRALDEEQFVVYLQPKCSLKTGEVFGAEALVRWNHPERGVLTPAMFIPIFEKNGFITKLDYYMWESVCKIIRKWIDEGKEPIPLSVNMSRVSMYNPSVSELLEGLVNKYNVSPKLVNIEITESAYMDNPSIMKHTLNQLKQSGFVVMMDDFGSGYSSLNTLKDLDVDVVKIDMNFLPQNDNKEKGETILSSVVDMIEDLDMDSIIEGVESDEQKKYLEEIGCDYAQGYYFSKPIPLEEFEGKFL